MDDVQDLTSDSTLKRIVEKHHSSANGDFVWCLFHLFVAQAKCTQHVHEALTGHTHTNISLRTLKA